MRKIYRKIYEGRKLISKEEIKQEEKKEEIKQEEKKEKKAKKEKQIEIKIKD